MNAVFVTVRFAGRKLGVPLDQLEVIADDEDTREGVGDWRYWVSFEPYAPGDCGEDEGELRSYADRLREHRALEGEQHLLSALPGRVAGDS